jgi:hypothetical protein
MSDHPSCRKLIFEPSPATTLTAGDTIFQGQPCGIKNGRVYRFELGMRFVGFAEATVGDGSPLRVIHTGTIRVPIDGASADLAGSTVFATADGFTVRPGDKLSIAGILSINGCLKFSC